MRKNNIKSSYFSCRTTCIFAHSAFVITDQFPDNKYIRWSCQLYTGARKAAWISMCALFILCHIFLIKIVPGTKMVHTCHEDLMSVKAKIDDR